MSDTTEHPAQTTALDSLQPGVRVLVNDRQTALTVTGQHKRQQTTSAWRQRDENKYHTVFELEGNGTTYHLVCTGGSAHGPMLYKESEWNDDDTDELGQSPKYTGGERVTELTIPDTD